MSFDRTKNNWNYTLYLVTDRTIMTTATLEEAVSQAIDGGCTMVQLREKNSTSLAFYKTAVHLRALTKERNIPLIINDRLDIAMAVGADGVHLGQTDLPCREARKILGNTMHIGVSAATVAEALQAQTDGADYLGVGAVYGTATKTNTRSVTPELLAEITAAVSIPVVAIGGIHAQNIQELAGTGIDGIAVVSAILANPHITAAAQTLRQKAEALFHDQFRFSSCHF